MNSLPVRSQGNLLNSWKEISSYLGRGVRTVQRWEVELNLPVHRIGVGRRSPVFAFEHELRFWLQARKVNDPVEERASNKASTGVPSPAIIQRSAELAQRLLVAGQENRRLMNVLARNLNRISQARRELQTLRGDKGLVVPFPHPARRTSEAQVLKLRP